MKLQALQTKITSVALATVLGAAPALAIELNPTIDLTGYVVGSVRYVDQGDSNTTMDLDATKVLASVKTEPVSGAVSFYSSGTDNVSILDAYFTYDLGEGTTVTAGKFLSWHGYEAFDIPNMLQITYSNDFAALIPGYHKGIKIEHGEGGSKFGFAVLDAVYNSDGDLSNGVGYEAYYTYSMDALTAYVGLAYDEGSFNTKHSMVDVWVQYKVGAVTYAGEIATGKYDANRLEVKSAFWTLQADIELDAKSHLLVRVNGSEDKQTDDLGSLGKVTTKPKSLKGTVAYRYKVSDNFTVVGEVSYSDLNDAGGDNKTFLGAQGRFTF